MTLSLGDFYSIILDDAKKQKIPLSGHFELTSRCNLACKMCYLSKPYNDQSVMAEELSNEEWLKIAEEARQMGMLNLLLSGGEVFLRKDFRSLYEALFSMGFLITIYTNATLITAEHAAWLGKMMPLKIEATLYGASAETYGKVTGQPDAFARALNGIDLLIAEKIPVQLRTTAIRDNYLDFAAIAKIAEERSLKLGVVNYITPARKNIGRKPVPLRLPVDVQIEYERMVEKYFDIDTVQESLERINYEEFSSQSGDYSDQDPNDAYFCLAGKTTFWITWKGEMTTCASMEETGIYPLQNSFKEAWRNLQLFCQNTPVCKECQNCPYKIYCLSCPARLKIETGSFDQPSRYFCELVKRKAEKS